jgi:hypothetical protein
LGYGIRKVDTLRAKATEILRTE